MKILTIENKSAKVKLNDSVNPWSTDDLIADIERVYGDEAVTQNLTVAGITASADSAVDTLEIEINSPGGSVFDGFRIYQALQSMKQRGVRVVATINSLAASMASVIVMAADEIRMVEGGRMMIHEASTGVQGTAADHARAAKILDEISDEIAQIYSNRTGASNGDMRELMKAETWMGTKEAKERKFIDAILSGSKTKAEAGNFDIGAKSGKITDMSLLQRITNPSAQEAVEQIAALTNRASELENDLTKAAEELKAMADTVAAKDQCIAESAAKIDDLEASIAAAMAKADEQAAKLAETKAKLEEAQQAAGTKAAEILAKAGQPEPVIMSGTEEHPPLTEAEKIKNMSPAERTRYFRAKKKGNK